MYMYVYVSSSCCQLRLHIGLRHSASAGGSKLGLQLLLSYRLESLHVAHPPLEQQKEKECHATNNRHEDYCIQQCATQLLAS